MVKPVTRISASAESEVTRIDHSLSITSEPDNAWVAARQDRMTADGEGRERSVTESDSDDHAPEEADEALLSGESERIGSQNFDEDTPFGDRVAII